VSSSHQRAHRLFAVPAVEQQQRGPAREAGQPRRGHAGRRHGEGGLIGGRSCDDQHTRQPGLDEADAARGQRNESREVRDDERGERGSRVHGGTRGPQREVQREEVAAGTQHVDEQHPYRPAPQRLGRVVALLEQAPLEVVGIGRSPEAP